MADILHLIKINAPQDALHRALATSEGVRNWLSRDADLPATTGGEGEIRFAGGTRILRIELVELAPRTRVAWKVLAAAMPTWPGTRIEFEARADTDGAMLHFAHRGFREADDLFAMSASIWACFLLSLKQYLETGTGTPHPDDALSRPPAQKQGFGVPMAPP